MIGVDSYRQWRTSMGGAITYLILLGAAFGTAMALYFGFRAIKLI
jgi:hypothetical protein